MVELVDNPTHAKQVCRIIGNEWIGFLWLPPNRAELSFWSSTSAVSRPYLQLSGQGGMEAAFLDPTGAAGTVLEEANRSDDRPGPEKGRDHQVTWGRTWNQVAHGENQSDLGRNYVGIMSGLDFPSF